MFRSKKTLVLTFALTGILLSGLDLLATRDPIEEAGGVNLYAFVNNDPVNYWDYLGLDWKISRKGKSRADVCADSNTDTLSTLATIIGLDASEYKKWLQDKGGNALSSLPKTGVTYTIPNTVVLSIGGFGDKNDPNDNIQDDVDMLTKFDTGLKGDGYNTITYFAMQDYIANLKTSLGSADVTGWVHSGHGRPNTIVAYNTGYVHEELFNMYSKKKRSLQNLNRPVPQTLRDKLKYHGGLSNTLKSKAQLTANTVSGLRLFKFSYLILGTCRVNRNGSWDALVSKNGVKYLPVGLTYPSKTEYKQPPK